MILKATAGRSPFGFALPPAVVLLFAASGTARCQSAALRLNVAGAPVAVAPSCPAQAAVARLGALPLGLSSTAGLMSLGPVPSLPVGLSRAGDLPHPAVGPAVPAARPPAVARRVAPDFAAAMAPVASPSQWSQADERAQPSATALTALERGTGLAAQGSPDPAAAPAVFRRVFDGGSPNPSRFDEPAPPAAGPPAGRSPAAVLRNRRSRDADSTVPSTPLETVAAPPAPGGVHAGPPPGSWPARAIFSLGAGLLKLALWGVGMQLAVHSGYIPRGDYFQPLPGGALGAAYSFAMYGLISPVGEELFFRLGLFEWTNRLLTGRAGLGTRPAAAVAAVASALVFVVLHETSDPFFFVLRFAQALALVSVYRRAGVEGSILAHMAYNSGFLLSGSPLTLNPAVLAVSLAGAALWAVLVATRLIPVTYLHRRPAWWPVLRGPAPDPP